MGTYHVTQLFVALEKELCEKHDSLLDQFSEVPLELTRVGILEPDAEMNPTDGQSDVVESAQKPNASSCMFVQNEPSDEAMLSFLKII